ncbi:TIGR01906 family membrane protein [Caminicella sporogenes]|uniref:TIGR01906 family membrane protein n=1 Tax=Caminicella sporogenes TaxID=166485 RepID=UPI0025422135|nr:TIGR01906 family membrane protein [Caminicella sporogenes]WIF95358.1 TIGR01906 family membrane protein [Caminicella sporogenes]
MIKYKSVKYIFIFRLLLIIFLPMTILLTILEFYAFNKEFYLIEFDKYNIYKTTKMNKEDISKVADKLISYMKGEINNLNITAKINGITDEVFGQREKQHMIDVQMLFNRGFKLRKISFIVSLLSLFGITFLAQDRKRELFKVLLWAGIIPLVLMIILFILLKINFYKYFTIFHKIFFTNDLWLLNPETDVLIQMLPLGFFIDMCIRILTIFIVILFADVIISYFALNKFLN